MNNRLEQVQTGNHIIAIYKNRESKFDEAFKFLKDGLDNDEIIMMITDCLSKNEIRTKMKQEWSVNVGEMESKDTIHIRTIREWYYYHGFPNPEKIKAFWRATAHLATTKKKKGVRVFSGMHHFFERGHVNDLINYESQLDMEFNFPFTMICAYDSKDIESLTLLQRDVLMGQHNPIWK